MLRHRLSFPRGAEITVRQDVLLAMLLRTLRKRSRSLVCENTRLLEGGEVVVLL
jgi:hypothetical protein